MTSIKFRALNHADHKLFFEALGEYGKDFQNIQQYMTQKGGKSKAEQNNNNNNKSTDPQEKRDQDKKEDDKKREQIRNFYNKLYGKLSQLIGKLDDRVEKVYQELYILINYGEIWKKYGFIFNNKTKRLLEDLLYQGSTTLRFKNKNVRLRTPPCRALKKINQIGVDEKVKVVTTRELPKDVTVEFHPSTNRDWLKVQSISQNPRVRARLSIQKRLSNVLDFLESKWGISQDKLNRSIEAWLKLDSGNQQPVNTYDRRIRLKPSTHHEIKEVNITRVVPDNHLDLTLTAYIRRLGDSKPYVNQATNNQPQVVNRFNATSGDFASENGSRLPVSLTTPDCSILFEKSCTSDQPSIAQARKHLNLLQSLTGALDGCENSRMACEDTQDRSLSSIMNQIGQSMQGMPTHQRRSNHSRPALYDEDAALPLTATANPLMSSANDHADCEAGSSNKTVEFDLPKNVTLGDYFKMANEKVGGDSVIESDEAANDAFPISIEESNKKVDEAAIDPLVESDGHEGIKDFSLDTRDHLVDIKRLAEGWTRLDDASMTIGELYLALRCPDKIILEYAFEQLTLENQQPSTCNSSSKPFVQPVDENPSDGSLMFKLLTAASLSLSQIERQKHEQQVKLLDQQQSCSKFRRRKMGPGCQGNNMTLRDIEATNQRVEEALKQLQPTRLCSYRRAR